MSRRSIRTRGRKGLPKPCLVCGSISNYSYCSEHYREVAISAARERRSSSKRALYRARKLKATKHHCEKCGHHDATGKTLELDHIVSVGAGGSDTDYLNFQLLCKDCHNNKLKADLAQQKQPKDKPSNPMTG